MRVEEDTGVQVVAPAIDLVGVVGQVVVFKAVDPTIVVQVDAEQKLRAIGRIAEEGFFVIRDAVVENAVVVLVEVGDKVFVLVPPWEDGHIAAALREAEPISRAVLVVVVIDQLVQGRARIVVGNVPAVVHDKRTRRVIRVHAVRLAEKVKRGGHLCGVDHPSLGVAGVRGQRAIGCLARRVGVLAVRAADVEFRV